MATSLAVSYLFPSGGPFRALRVLVNWHKINFPLSEIAFSCLPTKMEMVFRNPVGIEITLDNSSRKIFRDGLHSR